MASDPGRTPKFQPLNWMDPSRRGYLKMTFSKTQAKGEWVFVNNVKSSYYTVETPATAETRTYTL